MEHLWSPAGATSGNRWQMGHVRKPLKQADPQPVATQGNRFAAHGKEGVDGSSPSEGFEEIPANQPLLTELVANVQTSTSTERPPPAESGFGGAWKPCRGAALRPSGPTS